MAGINELAMEANRETLKRIVALLLALADLAERASASPRPIRFLVLWILRPAEAVAREFVIGAAGDLGAPSSLLPASSLESSLSMVGGRGSESAADAVRLAVDFRMLAAMLDVLAALPLALRPTLRHAGLTRLRSPMKTGLAPEARRSLPKSSRRGKHRNRAWRAVDYHDTS